MLEVPQGVQGRLHADFVADGDQTRSRVAEAAAPLELRGPFADDSGKSRYYLRNVSCGIFAGDSYDIRLRASDRARVCVSASSATKVHEMSDGGASTSVHIEASYGAGIAYYDGPTILQAGSDLSQRVEIAANGGCAIYAEVLVLGRLSRDELVAFRRYRNELVVRGVDGRQLYVERYVLRPDTARESIMAASSPVLGKAVIVGIQDSMLSDSELTRDATIAGYDELPLGAGLILRVAGDRLEPVAQLIEAAVLAVVRHGVRLPL